MRLSYKHYFTKLVMTLKDSADENVRTEEVKVKIGRKWSTVKAVTESES